MQRGPLELRVLVGALLIVLAAWGFAFLAHKVAGGRTQSLDDRIILALRNPADPADPVGPAWVEEIGRDLTALGGVAAMALLTAGVLAYLAFEGRWSAAALVLAATAGGLVISTLLKAAFNRPRPALVPHLSHAVTSSFPSGHSLLSATVYLTLGVMLARLADRRREKVFFIAAALLLTLLVGSSRVYLGVHYPTDVLAGWTVGLAWALACWLAGRKLRISDL